MSIRIPGGGSGGIIKQFNADPGYPISDKTNIKSKDLWVLFTSGGAPSTEGMPMGLLLTLTYANTVIPGAATYQLSVNTTGGIQRINIP